MNHGTCGINLTWTLYDNGTLTISGRGAMFDSKIDFYNALSFIDCFKLIVIDYGVTSIGKGAFSFCRCLERVTIPDSVKTIGDEAFTLSYCGNGLANGGRNVYWTLEGGVLNLKKNPAAKNETDFSTGAVSWLALEKNITGINLEPGVVPKEKFFEWLGKRGNVAQISFT